MEYQVSRNRGRAHWIDGYYVERESLADFADKVEHTEQIYSNVQFRYRISIRKNLLAVLLSSLSVILHIFH